MIRRYSVLTGVIISFILLLVAISLYPGGSMFDKNAVGFDWSRNFISNLFAIKALNGSPNPARIWACAGMLILPCSYALFFIHMAGKIPDKKIGAVLKYGGLINILFMFLIVTPLHDLMLNISITVFWTCICFITGIILKTKLHLFKIICILCLLIFYFSIYLWATNDWILLPLMQKLNFIDSTLLILGLEYFTGKDDYALVLQKRSNKRRKNAYLNEGVDKIE